MASNLTAAELKKPGRIGLFLSKVKDKSPFELVAGGSVTITGVEVGPAKRRRVVDLNQLLPNQFESILNTERSLKYIATNGVKYPGGDLSKSDEFKDGKTSFNRGNVAEIIFAAAIVARFRSKTLNVTAYDIKSIVHGLGTSNTGEKSWKSENKNKKIKDDVLLKWGLSQNNWSAAQNKKLWSSFTDIIDSSLKYANSAVVKEWADLFYNNNLYNKILVLADGETDQKGTKVDVKVLANDHKEKMIPVNINVSLKYGAVGQFGQYGGVEYEIQQKLWKEFFGIETLGITKSQFDSKFGSAQHDKDAANAIYACYQSVVTLVEKAIVTKKGQKAFAAAIRSHSTRNEEHVTLVALKGSEAVNYTFENIEETFEGIDFSVSLDKSSARDKEKSGAVDLPIIHIYASEDQTRDNLLLDIRVKRGEKASDGTPYYRNIFEKKPAFTRLFAQVL